VSYNPNPQGQGWVTCRDRLIDVISKWRRSDGQWTQGSYLIECAAQPRYTTHFADKADRAVSVTFTAGDHVDRTVTVDRFERPVDNLWALAIGLDAVRLNELRGLDDVARQVYQALPAPKARDPWEVLGLRSDADEDAIDAVYRAKAKRMHPDAGGDPEAFKVLQAAYEAVKAK
jgi:hypothetical protein